VRNLERNIAAVCRAVATDIAKNKKKKATIDAGDLAKILGPMQYESELALRTGIPGVATALAFTPVGGEILFIESASMPGKGTLQLTGQIGDVMKESAQAAFSIVKSNAGKLGIEQVSSLNLITYSCPCARFQKMGQARASRCSARLLVCFCISRLGRMWR